MKEKKKMSLLAKQSAAGWVFLTPATILIAIMELADWCRRLLCHCRPEARMFSGTIRSSRTTQETKTKCITCRNVFLI